MHRRHLLGLAALAAAAPAVARAAPRISEGRPPAASGLRVVPIATGLVHPWGMAFLPDGTILATEKGERLVLIRNGQVEPIPGAPDVVARGQGGLLDVALHPNFAQNRFVYLTHAQGTMGANRTALSRGVLDGARLVEVRTLFHAAPNKTGTAHFGSRLLWLPDGTLLMSVGDGGNPQIQHEGAPIREQSQNPANHLGKMLRLDAEGRAPADNPFVRRAGYAAENWALGLRNVQGLAWDPVRNVAWCSDHGARFGDELNRLEAGGNFGWPRVTHAREYSGPDITTERSRPGMIDPALVWMSGFAPSGLAVCSGRLFPAWRGDIFAGGLVSRDIRRLVVDAAGRAVTQEEAIAIGARVRDVREGSDGLIYVLTDEAEGRLLRIEPA